MDTMLPLDDIFYATPPALSRARQPR